MRSILVLLKRKGRGHEGTLVSLGRKGRRKEAPSDECWAWPRGARPRAAKGHRWKMHLFESLSSNFNALLCFSYENSGVLM